MAELKKGTSITIAPILPGSTKSEGVTEVIKDLAKADKLTEEEVKVNFFKNMRSTSLTQRFASVDEIASTIVYYSSDLASATNEAAIRVEDGFIRSII